jgi:prepilin-type N-terminal cleavage/methylation domain-containing protein
VTAASSWVSRSRRVGSRGYSAIEVMIAMSLLAIASTGIFALQKVTFTGNSSAKNMAVANQIARTWVERLRTDSASWNYPSAAHTEVVCTGASTAGCVGGTTWLKAVSTPNVWFKPVAVPTRGGAAFDALGNDTSDSGSAPAFCTHLRLSWLYPNQLLRAEVRVFWLKDGGEGPVGGTLCDEATPASLGASTNSPLSRYHFAYFATSVAVNPAP